MRPTNVQVHKCSTPGMPLPCWPRSAFLWLSQPTGSLHSSWQSSIPPTDRPSIALVNRETSAAAGRGARQQFAKQQAQQCQARGLHSETLALPERPALPRLPAPPPLLPSSLTGISAGWGAAAAVYVLPVHALGLPLAPQVLHPQGGC
jgi:hypothetical protein